MAAEGSKQSSSGGGGGLEFKILDGFVDELHKPFGVVSEGGLKALENIMLPGKTSGSSKKGSH